MTSLQDKVVIITGASGGIGEATALLFAKYSARLVLTSRNVAKLQEIAEKCVGTGLPYEKVLTIGADVTIDADVERVVKETVERFGGIDVLINNAAKLYYNLAVYTPMDVFDDVMRTNIRAPFYLSKLCVPYLIKSKGNIVQVSSISGQSSYQGEAAYAISKGALDHFTRILAMEVAGQNVRVNTVSPVVTLTHMQKKAGMSDEQYDKYMETSGEANPMRGVASPEQVAKMIAFLASDDAGFTTGQIVCVDGGRVLKSV